MDATSKRDEIEALRQRVERLEAEVSSQESKDPAHISREYVAYYATAGAILGVLGSMTSLLFNIVGSVVAGKSPLELIRIYMTFPLGERALQLTEGTTHVYAVGDGMILALGCCLYMGTGMILGIPLVVVMHKFAPRGSLIVRLALASVLALAIWGINFYGILSWLQPQLFNGSWIVDGKLLPWWVAAATHLVFGWTIAVLYPFVQSSAAPRST